jgi:5-methylcytosine-specific restriction endonuclease McrA
LEAELCKWCGGELDFHELFDSIHHGKLICSLCGRFHKWVKKPENNGKRTRTSIYDHMTPNVSHCGVCGRKRSELNVRETIELHHSIPLEEGGADEMDNIIWACTACHKHAHWVRDYFYIHLNIKFEKTAHV